MYYGSFFGLSNNSISSVDLVRTRHDYFSDSVGILAFKCLSLDWRILLVWEVTGSSFVFISRIKGCLDKFSQGFIESSYCVSYFVFSLCLQKFLSGVEVQLLPCLRLVLFVKLLTKTLS